MDLTQSLVYMIHPSKVNHLELWFILLEFLILVLSLSILLGGPLQDTIFFKN